MNEEQQTSTPLGTRKDFEKALNAAEAALRDHSNEHEMGMGSSACALCLNLDLVVRAMRELIAQNNALKELNEDQHNRLTNVRRNVSLLDEENTTLRLQLERAKTVVWNALVMDRIVTPEDF